MTYKVTMISYKGEIMAVVLQIGAGGVGGVVAHKMAQNREVFSRLS